MFLSKNEEIIAKVAEIKAKIVELTKLPFSKDNAGKIVRLSKRKDELESQFVDPTEALKEFFTSPEGSSVGSITPKNPSSIPLPDSIVSSPASQQYL